MNSIVTLPDGSLQCGCGAQASNSDSHARFRRRHPLKCSQAQAEREEKIRITKGLTGTRAIPDELPKFEDLLAPTKESKLILHQLAELEDAHGLTDWERDFLSSIKDQFRETEWLSDKQKEILGRIYEDRT